ncbi:PHB depolymerase family esterase [Corynebacterium accolens]|uniref:alpha/beta hydrolase family esterase n=1 Tax=Corynebacterium accolens TaxID=38284 RepID=UPI00254DD8D5|nr:PHB depolymerase family esterase [Corynebacterium accolens]MDK8498401.1 PHB depolymerase family esterase [Corynebacterium accolens]
MANVTKFSLRAGYLLAALLIASGAFSAPAVASAQETPAAPEKPAPPAPAPEPAPDDSHLLPEGVEESTPNQPAPAPAPAPDVAPARPAPDASINPHPPIAPGDTRSLEMEHEGKKRRYLLRIPDNYSPEAPTPVLFGFGGWGDSPEEFSGYARMETTAATDDAIVVYPEGFERAWEPAPYAKTRDGEDIRFIHRILNAVDADYHIDRNRIYAMGMSNGGGFTSVLGCNDQSTFAAVAMVSGAFYSPVESKCQDAPMHTLIMHGTHDKMMTYEGGDRHSAGYLPVRTVLGGYLQRNRCNMTFQVFPAPGDAEQLMFNDCHKDVQLVKVPAGHTWFWQPDTPKVVWDFLSTKTRV